MTQKYDFSGWATKYDLLCSDGRTIKPGAFKGNDKTKVPLVWNHQYGDVSNVVGHAMLEQRPEGIYAQGYFNNTPAGLAAKEIVAHGDVCALSIFANRLKQVGGDVVHGVIREVSLVLAGANPGASIEEVMEHSDSDSFEAVICHTDVDPDFTLIHAEDEKPAEERKEEATHAEAEGRTVADVFESMTEEQKNAVYAMIGELVGEEEAGEAAHTDLDGQDEKDEEETEPMKHNVFDQTTETPNEDVLTHAEIQAVFADVKSRKYSTLSDACLAHGIDNIDYLFPDAQNVTNTPQFISREMSWVAKVMSKVHKTPFSRIKSLFADITEDEARALGYIKGKLKKEEVFSLLKRTTGPQTIYKKQKLDRDDVIDITDFDVVAWLKSEMRVMLDEEIARAILIGDGRLTSSDDKIKEDCIRPIWTDADLYTIKTDIGAASTFTTPDARAKAFIRACVKSRKDYKGSGNPDLWTTEDMLTDCLLMEDNMGRVIYDSVDKLATAMRVSSIITVEVMEGATRDDNGTAKNLLGLIVNLADYNVGADKGGAVNMFEDFDIDYNAQKYLIETRCSGALIRPYSAIAIEETDDSQP